MVKKSASCTRRTHSPAFNAQVALPTLRDDKTMAQLCKEFDLQAGHPSLTLAERKLLIFLDWRVNLQTACRPSVALQ